MKICALFLVLTLTSLRGSAELDANGWRGMLKESLAKPLLVQPKVESRIDGNKAIIRITNNGKNSLSYRARGAASPVLYFEHYEKNAWRASGSGLVRNWG
ncbi:MAG: hypothetical protein QM760_18590 [Nibricoccus sp.]